MGESSIGRLIKKRRESLGLSQARLGELVGRSASTIRNWERDRTSPSERSDVVALAAILGLDERDALDQAGFDLPRQTDHPTMEQAFASLGPHPDEVLPLEDHEAEEPADDQPDVGKGTSGRRPEEWEEKPAEEAPISAPGPEPGKVGSGSRVDSNDDHPPVRRVVERAAPPTVLEAAPASEPSYLEDPEERQQYRLRGLVTTIAIVVLVIVLVWSFHRTTNALGNMWNQFMSMLDI